MRDSCFLSIHKNGPRRSSEAVFIFENERFFFIRIFTQTCSFVIKQQSNENDILAGSPDNVCFVFQMTNPIGL